MSIIESLYFKVKSKVNFRDAVSHSFPSRATRIQRNDYLNGSQANTNMFKSQAD